MNAIHSIALFSAKTVCKSHFFRIFTQKLDFARYISRTHHSLHVKVFLIVHFQFHSFLFNKKKSKSSDISKWNLFKTNKWIQFACDKYRKLIHIRHLPESLSSLIESLCCNENCCQFKKYYIKSSICFPCATNAEKIGVIPFELEFLY